MKKFRQFNDYLISSVGNVFSLHTGNWLKTGTNNRGYSVVRFQKNKKSHWFSLHRVIAECFIGKCPAGFTVNHKDGNKSNNYWRNLEYLSRSANIDHALDNGLYAVGPKSKSCKSSTHSVKLIRSFIHSKRRPITWLQGKTKLSKTQIYRILNNESRKRG